MYLLQIYIHNTVLFKIKCQWFWKYLLPWEDFWFFFSSIKPYYDFCLFVTHYLTFVYSFSVKASPSLIKMFVGLKACAYSTLMHLWQGCVYFCINIIYFTSILGKQKRFRYLEDILHRWCKPWNVHWNPV